MIKRILYTISVCALAFQSNGMLVESYAEHVYKFSKDTDLIRGYVLSSDGLLKTARFMGNMRYFYETGKHYDGNSCSFKDSSLVDPVADLLVQLFPSCGNSLNAQGTGSIAFIPAKQADFIAGMFNIDADIRKNRERSDIFAEIEEIDSIAEGNPQKGVLVKQFGAKYFQLKRGKNEYFQKLFRLGKNIATSIMMERQEESAMTTSLQQKPYPPFYTNDLICAYVWNALPTSKLDELARKLGFNEEREAYHSELTTRILEEISKNPSLMPFSAGQQIITNATTEYKGQKFADCVETAVRQLFSCVFCKSTLNSEKKYTGELTLDLSRIPEKAIELREFFAPHGEPRNIRELANDGAPETRKEWAEIMSGHQSIGNNRESKAFISYADVDHNMYGGWNNIIKIFCFLMDGYSANQDGPSTPKKLAAEKRVKEINEAVKTGTFTITKDTLLPIINDLLGIRTDVELIAEENQQIENLQDANSDIEGCISIYPKDHEKGNKLNFISYKTHGQLLSIPREKTSFTTPLSSAPWIELLYSNRELAIRGKEINPANQSYPSLNESLYPLLDFYMRLGGEIREEWVIPTLCDMLNTTMPHIDAVSRVFFDGHGASVLLNFLKAAQEQNVPLQALISVCALVAEYSDCYGNAVTAIKFLKQYMPDSMSKFSGLSKTFDERELIVQRMAFGRYKETDPIIEDFVKTHPTQEVFDFFFKIYGSYAIEREKPSDIPPFAATMLDAFIPHIQALLEKIKLCGSVNEIESFKTLGVLDLIDFKEKNPAVIEFIEKIAGTQKTHFFPLLPNISRSQEKLDLLLPISRAPAVVADRIFREYTGRITPQVAASLIMKISEDNIQLLISRLTERKLSASLIRELIDRDNYIVNDDITANNGDRIKKIIDRLFEKYGKFDDESAKELIDKFPSLSLFITARAEFTPKLKDMLIDKFDANDDNQFLKYQSLLPLLDSNYAFIPEVCKRMQGVDSGCMFFAYFSVDTEGKMKEMSDRLVLNIAKHFEKTMRVFTFTDYLPKIRDSLVTELEKRFSIPIVEKEKLIEDLKNYQAVRNH